MSLETILRSHSRRYPSWQVQDVYKLAHQAAFGPGHMVKDPSSARLWLDRELAEMGEGPTEPVIDPISADGAIVRVHLRPYLAGSGDPEALLAAFLDSANQYKGEAEILEVNWVHIGKYCSFPAAEMSAFFKEMKVQGYPAVHHSEEYRKHYRPAYRVIGLKYLPNTRN